MYVVKVYLANRSSDHRPKDILRVLFTYFALI